MHLPHSEKKLCTENNHLCENERGRGTGRSVHIANGSDRWNIRELLKTGQHGEMCIRDSLYTELCAGGCNTCDVHVLACLFGQVPLPEASTIEYFDKVVWNQYSLSLKVSVNNTKENKTEYYSVNRILLYFL